MDNPNSRKSHHYPGPATINARYRIGVLELDDVSQTIRADVNCFFYFRPQTDIAVPDGGQNVRFENILKPNWVPHFDFENEVEEALVTDESYWLDTKTGLVFGRVNWVPHIQERFDHRPFPFDRQIVDIRMFTNNCMVEEWALTNKADHPREMGMDDSNWVSQCELNAVADAWDLKKLRTHCLNDEESKSCILHFQVYLERASAYYFWNVIMIYFIIIVLKVVIIAFPYNETRFEYAMTLALTTVAFKFVTAELVPKTSYVTYLDRFMLFGLVLLFIRFMADLGIQLLMTEQLPRSDGEVRVECTEDNENYLGITPCTVDTLVAGALLIIWLMAVLIYSFFTYFPSLVKPAWKNLDSPFNDLKSKSHRIQREVLGSRAWEHVEYGGVGSLADTEAVSALINVEDAS